MAEQVHAQVPGETLTLAGREFVIAPLSFKAVRSLLPRLQQLQLNGTMSEQDFDLIAEVALASFRRNYPSMTPEELDDIIDMANFKEVFETIIRVSGLEAKKVGSPVGEA